VSPHGARPDNLQISADYVGAMRAHRKAIPGATGFRQWSDRRYQSLIRQEPVDENLGKACAGPGETLGEAVAKVLPRIQDQARMRNSVHCESPHLRPPLQRGRTVDIAMGVGMLGETKNSTCLFSLSADPLFEHQYACAIRDDCNHPGFSHIRRQKVRRTRATDRPFRSFGRRATAPISSTSAETRRRRNHD